MIFGNNNVIEQEEMFKNLEQKTIWIKSNEKI